MIIKIIIFKYENIISKYKIKILKFVFIEVRNYLKFDFYFSQ